MKMTPAPRFLHIVSVKLAENKINGVHVVDETACAMGEVVSNASERLAHIKPGDIVFFGGENSNFVKHDADGENIMLFEDAVMGSCTTDQLPAPLAREQNFIKTPERPLIRANGDAGVIVRKPHIR